MSEYLGRRPKESEPWSDWRRVDLRDDDGQLYGGFLRERRRELQGRIKRRVSTERQFCYQPEGEGAMVTGVEPCVEQVPATGGYVSVSEYAANLVHIEYPDGRKQTAYVPLGLKTERGEVVSIGNSTNFFAIDNGKVPSND